MAKVQAAAEDLQIIEAVDVQQAFVEDDAGHTGDERRQQGEDHVVVQGHGRQAVKAENGVAAENEP